MVVRISSAIPLAILPIILAVAGAIRQASASSAKERCSAFLISLLNNMMYENPILQRNIGSLKAIGFKFIGPERGDLADGKIGLGRMTEPQEIVECLERVMQSRDDFLGNFLRGQVL